MVRLNTPIQWGAYSAETLEMTMAVLLHQSRPQSVHRTPSQGDGGVDVFEPDGDQFDVYQIKGFVGRLSEGSRKHQIEKSLRAATDDPRLPGPVRNWILVVPIDFTSGEEQWFEELTSGAPFSCSWRGETFWHSEAARFPYVVDYYLLNGRLESDRLLREAIQFAEVQFSAAVAPADALDRMRALAERVNDSSPHYHFDFHVTATMPALESRPGVVMSYTQGSVGGGPFATVDVIARFPQALKLEPISGTIRFAPDAVADSHPDFARVVTDWMEYGGEITIPPGGATFVLEGPLAWTSESASVGGWIGSPEPAQETRLRLRLTAPDGEISDLPVVVIKGGRGLVGDGREFHVDDFEELLRVRFRMQPATGAGTIDVSTTEADLAGRAISRVQPVISFLAAFRAGNTLDLLHETGTAKIVSTTLDQSFEADDQMTEVVELLHRLQPFADRPILFPARMDNATWQDLNHALLLLTEGERWGTWTGMNLRFNADVDDDQIESMRSPKHLVRQDRLVIELDGQVVDFGPTFTTFYSAVLTDVAADRSGGRLVPGDDDRYVERVGTLRTD